MLLFFPPHKRGDSRVIVMDDELMAVVDEIEASRPVWSRRAWNWAVKKFGRHIKPHDLRHTAATELFMQGYQVGDVQAMLGHKSPQMAQQLYIKTRPRLLKPVTFSSPVGLRTEPKRDHSSPHDAAQSEAPEGPDSLPTN